MIELRPSMVFGLFAILATSVILLFFVGIGFHMAGFKVGRITKKIMVVSGLLTAVWLIACIWTGYRSHPKYEDRSGEIHFVGELFSEPRGKPLQSQIHERGVELQQRGLDDLNSFRESFFKEEKQ